MLNMTEFNLLLQRRQRAQQLHLPRYTCPAALVRHLGAVQAQDYAGALWSLGLRLPGCRRVELEAALARRDFVRTWGPRGTLHFVAAADLRWLLALLAPRMIAGMRHRYRQLELDEAQLQRANALLVSALAQWGEGSRRELLAYLQAEGLSTTGQRASHILQRASLDGLICQIAVRRNQPVFALVDGHFPELGLSREEALARLAQRYFSGHGPATLADFAWWSGLTKTEARKGLQAAVAALNQLDIAGQKYWWSPETECAEPAPEPQLLPGFDEYLLGYRERSAALPLEYAPHWCPGNNGMFMPFLLSQGQMVGLWKRQLKTHSVRVELHPLRDLTTAERASFEASAQCYAHFVELELDLCAL